VLSKKELEQAFPETPDIVHHRIYQAFRKGEKKLKARKRMVQSLSFAAAFLMMVCMGLLMRHVHLSPAPDVLHPGVGNSPDPLASATSQLVSQTGQPVAAETSPLVTALQTASPVPSVTPEPTVTPTPAPPTEAPTAALTNTPAPEPIPEYDEVYDAEEKNAGASSVISDEVEEQLPFPQFYATEYGQYYHLAENCTGMKGAQAFFFYDVVDQGKTACPNCLGGSLDNVYLPDGNPYYHVGTGCLSKNSIKKAAGYTEDMALLLSALPCPDCTEANSDRISEVMLNVQLAAGELVVYTCQPGADYHRTPNACGNSDDKYDRYALLLGPALREGSLPCEHCYPGFVIEAPLYFTPGGMYFHTVSDCSGMKNASPNTLEAAIECGKQVCPVCCPFIAGNTEGARIHLTYLFHQVMGAEIPFPEKQAGVYAGQNDRYFYGYQADYGINEMQSDQLDIDVDGRALYIRMMYAQPDGMSTFLESCENSSLLTACKEVSECLLQLGEADAYLKALQVNCELASSPYAPQEVSYELAYIIKENTEGVDVIWVQYDTAEQKISSMNWDTVPFAEIPDTEKKK